MFTFNYKGNKIDKTPTKYLTKKKKDSHQLLLFYLWKINSLQDSLTCSKLSESRVYDINLENEPLLKKRRLNPS